MHLEIIIHTPQFFACLQKHTHRTPGRLTSCHADRHFLDKRPPGVQQDNDSKLQEKRPQTSKEG